VKRGTIIVLAIVAVLVLGGGTVALVAIDKRRMAALLREAFRKAGLPPEWAEAIGRQESGLVSTAVNRSGADGERGGAYGATQITWRTLLAHAGGEVSFSPDEFLSRPELQAEWTARIMAAGAPQTIEDAGAWWNAGRKRFADLGPTHVTRTTYVPSLVKHLAKVNAA
jgi:Tfp pilus assembly protein PilX